MTGSTIEKPTKAANLRKLLALGDGFKNVKAFFHPLEKQKQQQHLSGYYNIKGLRLGRSNIASILSELRTTEASFLKRFWFLSADNTSAESFDAQNNPCYRVLDAFKDVEEMQPLMNIISKN